jgi:hypothetical protein
MADRSENNLVALPQPVGYKRPPGHTRFKPGQSGNPSGRAKGNQNFKSLFHKILKEQVSLREGSDLRKVSKAEAIMRSLIVGALKGDSRSLATMFRLAEQVGQFEDDHTQEITVRRFVVGWKNEFETDASDEVPASRDNYRDKV